MLKARRDKILEFIAHIYPHTYFNLIGASKAFISINLHDKHLH